MRFQLFISSFILLSNSLVGQLTHLPLQIAVTRFGQIIANTGDFHHQLPFPLIPNATIDSIFQCEQYQYWDVDTNIIHVPCSYKWPIPDTIISLSTGYHDVMPIPMFHRGSSSLDLWYSQINDSVWLGKDTLRPFRYREKWYLDKDGNTKRIEFILGDIDSVDYAYDYVWLGDGRIRSVVYRGDTSLLPRSFEYCYNNERRILAYCSHEGLPYEDIYDSVSVWSTDIKKMYNDTFPKLYFHLFPRSGSSMISLTTFSYEENLLTNVFHFSSGSNVGSDSIFYDNENRISKVKYTASGFTTSEQNFQYNNFLQRLEYTETVHFRGENEAAEFTSVRFHYGNGWKISELVLNYEQDRGRIIHHSFQMYYRFGND